MNTTSVMVEQQKTTPVKLLSYKEMFPKNVVIDGAGAGVLSYYLITQCIPIHLSDDGAQKLFQSYCVSLPNFDSKKFKILISGSPSVPEPLIVDDGIFINGRIEGGSTGLKGDPKAHLGQDPIVSYHPREAIDVTNDLRRDGQLFIQLMDLGGYTYASSRLYLIVQPI